MIPTFREFFRRLLFDKGAFLLWSRAGLMALAQFGMLYSESLAPRLGLSDGTVELACGILSGVALLLPAGDKTTIKTMAAAVEAGREKQGDAP